jgi:hypothetical protein
VLETFPIHRVESWEIGFETMIVHKNQGHTR